MPAATTPITSLIDRCQRRVSDTTTDIMSSANWLATFNTVQHEILNDLIFEKAYPLIDDLHDYVEITMVVDQEEYDWKTAIDNAAKYFYSFMKATWGDYEVREMSIMQYNDLLNGRLTADIYNPRMIFWSGGKFRLQPKPKDTTDTFYFYFIKELTDAIATSDKPILNEICVPLFVPKMCAVYWRRRKRFDLALVEDNENMRKPGNYQSMRKRIVKPYKKYSLKRVMSTDVVVG
jgi:hypothetical protein